MMGHYDKFYEKQVYDIRKAIEDGEMKKEVHPVKKRIKVSADGTLINCARIPEEELVEGLNTWNDMAELLFQEVDALDESDWKSYGEALKDARRGMEPEPAFEVKSDLFMKRVHAQYEPEFDDLYKVMEMGASKHGERNWLEPNGSKSCHADMCASMFRHLAEASTGMTRDHESGLHPLLHLITRALMLYTRQQRGIEHKEDLVDG